MTAPEQLTVVADNVDARMIELLDAECKKWTEVDPRLTELVDELARMVSSGGKRLRSAFVYWAWRGACTDADEVAAGEAAAFDAGAAFEFLQTFALIHDDIMDDSAYRRGAVTVHTANAQRLTDAAWTGEPRRYGEGVAILVGDLGHVLADGLMAGRGQRVAKLWDELRIELNLGQYLDLRSAAAGDFDQATARQVATFKTALYTIVRPLQLGASLTSAAGAASAPAPGQVSSRWSEEDYRQMLNRLDRFGRPLGRAFQLRDDVLGLVGDNTAMGKPVGDDLREGKPTELIAHAVANANPAQRQVLEQIGDRNMSSDDAQRLVNVVRETGALEANEAEIERLLGESKQALATLDFQPEAVEALDALADYVVERDR